MRPTHAHTEPATARAPITSLPESFTPQRKSAHPLNLSAIGFYYYGEVARLSWGARGRSGIQVFLRPWDAEKKI